MKAYTRLLIAVVHLLAVLTISTQAMGSEITVVKEIHSEGISCHVAKDRILPAFLIVLQRKDRREAILYLNSEGTITKKQILGEKEFMGGLSTNGDYFAISTGMSTFNLLNSKGEILWKAALNGWLDNNDIIAISNIGTVAIIKAAKIFMDVHNIRFYSSSGMLLNEYVSPAPLEKLTHNMFSWQGKFFLIGTAGHGDKTGKEREGRAIALFRGDGTHLWTIRPDFNFPALSGLTISHSEDRIAAWGETVIMDHVTKDPTKMVKSARSYIYFLDMNGNITAKHITDGWIRYVVLSPEGKYAAACTKEKVLLVNAENGNLVWEYKEMRNFISIDVSKEGERVVASGKERKCLLFDKSGRIIGEAKRKSSSPSYFSVKISDDGKLIQAEGTDGITLFEVK